MACTIMSAPAIDVDMQMLGMIAAKWMSRAIATAAELGVADCLSDGPKSAAELARETGAHAPSLYRLMRALTLNGVFVELPGRRFDLTPLSERLRSNVPSSMRNIARMMGAEWTWKPWGELDYCVRTGHTGVERALGAPIFDYLGEHPEDASVFDAAMTEYSRFTGPAVAEAYHFGRFRRIVDVAGGHGMLLFQILSRHARPEGIVFDLPHVVEGTRAAIRTAGYEGRCVAASGDFFDAVPPGADAYLLKYIIHDWDDERALAILRNVRRAIVPGGRLLLCEVVVPGPGEESFAKLLDLEMLVLPGGKERTVSEYRELLAAAGFRLIDVHPTASPMSLVEAEPV